jgi:selenocysteine-specific elongation factor
VLRDAAAQHTIGGGVIVDLSPPERRRATPERRAALAARSHSEADEALSALTACPQTIVDLTAFAQERALAADFVETAPQRLGLVALRSGGAMLALSDATWRAMVARVVAHLEAAHRKAPDRPGVDAETIRRALVQRLPATALNALIERLVGEGHAVREGSLLRRPDHRVVVSAEDARTWALVVARLGSDVRFRPPRVRDLAHDLDLDEQRVRKVMVAAARRGLVAEIAQDHYFLAETVIEMADVVRDLGQRGVGGEFTAAELRDRLDNGRKVAIQILEYFDRHGLTMRRGDKRRINRPKQALFSRGG